MSKKTAAEWLVEQVKSPEWQDYFIWHKEEVFQQAKEMEKQQIIDAYKYGNQSDMYFKPEQYYTETFKNK